MGEAGTRQVFPVAAGVWSEGPEDPSPAGLAGTAPSHLHRAPLCWETQIQAEVQRAVVRTHMGVVGGLLHGPPVSPPPILRWTKLVRRGDP